MDNGASATAPLIELRGVQKVYSETAVHFAALADVSLRVHEGEFVAIMGPSGSGKSTLLNLIGCLDRATAGTYLLGGRDVTRLGRTELARLRNRELGFVFQHFNLLRRYTAVENVELPMLYAGVAARQRRQRALELLERLGMTAWAGHLPNQLSGGQQQRIAIARALANRPRIILADEPTGNLDSRSGAEVIAELSRLNREGGQTVLMVTHDPTVAAATGRIVFVRDGRIESDRPNPRPEVPAATHAAARQPEPVPVPA